MTETEKLALLKIYTADTGENDALLVFLLQLSSDKIMRTAYPFDYELQLFPSRYDLIQIEIATYLYNKMGAEGQTSHAENGITRTYSEADIPINMLRGISPHVGRLF